MPTMTSWRDIKFVTPESDESDESEMNLGVGVTGVCFYVFTQEKFTPLSNEMLQTAKKIPSLLSPL